MLSSSSSRLLSYPSQSSPLQVLVALSLTKPIFTFNIEGTRHEVPVVKEQLYFRSGNRPVSHPILDSWQVESDLPIDKNSLTGCPVSHVLNEPSFDIFAIGSHNDPPKWLSWYQ